MQQLFLRGSVAWDGGEVLPKVIRRGWGLKKKGPA